MSYYGVHFADSDEEEFSGNEGKGDVKDEEGEQSDDSEDEDSDSDHEDLFSGL